MGTSKILFDGVGIDLTSDTVSQDSMLSGVVAHDSNGDVISGNIKTFQGESASGVIKISDNGEYDVTNYASANVSVLSGNPNSKVVYVTLSSDVTDVVILTQTTDEDIISKRSDPSMSAYLEALFDVKTKGVVAFMTRNKNVGSPGNSSGWRLMNGTFGTSVTPNGMYEKINPVQNGQITLNTDGTIKSKGSSNVPLLAGNYKITFLWG